MSKLTLLNQLINYEIPPDEINKNISNYLWDSESELTILTRNQLRNFLKIYVEHRIDENEVENWANLIEGREDIGYEANYEGLLKQFIYRLANPYLVGEITRSMAEKMMLDLDENTYKKYK